MPKLCLWDVEPRSYHKPSASQVGALPQKTALMRHFMSTCYSPERQQETGRPQLCVLVGNYRSSTQKRNIYCSSSISNLHLLYIRTLNTAGVYLLFSRP